MLVPPKKENRVELCAMFVDHLRTVGIKHITLLSTFGGKLLFSRSDFLTVFEYFTSRVNFSLVQMEENMFAKHLRIIEKHIEASGISFTFLRCTAFMEILLELSESVKNGRKIL